MRRAPHVVWKYNELVILTDDTTNHWPFPLYFEIESSSLPAPLEHHCLERTIAYHQSPSSHTQLVDFTKSQFYSFTSMQITMPSLHGKVKVSTNNRSLKLKIVYTMKPISIISAEVQSTALYHTRREQPPDNAAAFLRRKSSSCKHVPEAP